MSKLDSRSVLRERHNGFKAKKRIISTPSTLCPPASYPLWAVNESYKAPIANNIATTSTTSSTSITTVAAASSSGDSDDFE